MLTWRDYAVVGLFCLLLFGYSMFSGRPLTMHEARLPQCARDMAATGQWLFPSSGDRPWLERPPLPHWILAAVGTVAGRFDMEWAARLPSALLGCLTVLLVMWIAGRCFGRIVALISGPVLATLFEFYTYSTLAEDDIYLCAIVTAAVALFVRQEFRMPRPDGPLPGSRPPWSRTGTAGLLILLGLSNLAKGPLLGAMTLVPVAASFLLWERDRSAARRYLLSWGWLPALAIGFAWPLAAYRRYPDILEMWQTDYLGRMNGTYPEMSQPVWYYLQRLPGDILPWTPFALVGLSLTWPLLRLPEGRAARMLWCWALVPLAVFSIPQGKHHHYLLAAMAPWAILAAVALAKIGQRLKTAPKPRPRWMLSPVMWSLVLAPPTLLALWFHRDHLPGPAWASMGLAAAWLTALAAVAGGVRKSSGSISLTACLAVVGLTYCWGQSTVAASSDHTLGDTHFAREVRRFVPEGQPVLINAQSSLNFFRLAFYTAGPTRVIHNLSFLRDQRLTGTKQVYVIARAGQHEVLSTLGKSRLLLRSANSHGDNGKPELRFALFRLEFAESLQRFAAPRISPNQALERGDPGPFCGPPL